MRLSKFLIPALLIAGALIFLAIRSLNPKVIPYTRAAEFVGREKTVSGTIQSVFNNGKAVYLDFGDPHTAGVKLFRVRILKNNWSNFPKAPEDIYHTGDIITVTGKIEWYQGDPVISVKNPLDIKQ